MNQLSKSLFTSPHEATSFCKTGRRINLMDWGGIESLWVKGGREGEGGGDKT